MEANFASVLSNLLASLLRNAKRLPKLRAVEIQLRALVTRLIICSLLYLGTIQRYDPQAFLDRSRGRSSRRQCLCDSDNMKRQQLRRTKINPSMSREDSRRGIPKHVYKQRVKPLLHVVRCRRRISRHSHTHVCVGETFFFYDFLYFKMRLYKKNT